MLVSRFFRVFTQWHWPTPVTLCAIEEEELGFPVWDPRKNLCDRTHRMPIITPTYPCMNSSYNASTSTVRVMIEQFQFGNKICQDLAPPPRAVLLPGGAADGRLHGAVLSPRAQCRSDVAEQSDELVSGSTAGSMITRCSSECSSDQCANAWFTELPEGVLDSFSPEQLPEDDLHELRWSETSEREDHPKQRPTGGKKNGGLKAAHK